MIRIDTLKYVAVHGHTPRQPRGQRISSWAFQIDCNPEPVVITASYRRARNQARARARWSIVVLP